MVASADPDGGTPSTKRRGCSFWTGCDERKVCGLKKKRTSESLESGIHDRNIS
jgi:hypothetical protein